MSTILETRAHLVSNNNIADEIEVQRPFPEANIVYCIR